MREPPAPNLAANFPTEVPTMGPHDKSKRAFVQLLRDAADAIDAFDYWNAPAMTAVFEMTAKLARDSGDAQLVYLVAVGGNAALTAVRKAIKS